MYGLSYFYTLHRSHQTRLCFPRFVFIIQFCRLTFSFFFFSFHVHDHPLSYALANRPKSCV